MGTIIVILASVLFGIFPSIQKNVLASGVTPISLVIICNGTACILSLIISLLQGKSLKVTRRQLVSLALIGIIGLFTTDFLLDIAYTMIPVGYVTMVHFLYPAIVCGAMAVIFKERLTKGKILAIIFSVLGLVLLAGGGFSGSFIGIVVAAITAISYAFYMIATEKTEAGDVDPMVRVFYTNIFVTIAAAIISIRMKVVLPQAPLYWGESLLIGLMLFSAIFLLNLGVKKIGAGKASLINMLEPITSMVVSMLIYHYPIKPLALVGSFLIILSLFFAAKGDRKHKAEL